MNRIGWKRGKKMKFPPGVLRPELELIRIV